jgi:hypothetical protein
MQRERPPRRECHTPRTSKRPHLRSESRALGPVTVRRARGCVTVGLYITGCASARVASRAEESVSAQTIRGTRNHVRSAGKSCRKVAVGSIAEAMNVCCCLARRSVRACECACRPRAIAMTGRWSSFQEACMTVLAACWFARVATPRRGHPARARPAGPHAHPPAPVWWWCRSRQAGPARAAHTQGTVGRRAC